MKIRDIITERVHRIEHRGGGPVAVIENPSQAQMMNLFKTYGIDVLRGVLDADDRTANLFVGPANLLTHTDIANNLGLDLAIRLVFRQDGDLILSYADRPEAENNVNLLRSTGGSNPKITDEVYEGMSESAKNSCL